MHLECGRASVNVNTLNGARIHEQRNTRRQARLPTEALLIEPCSFLTPFLNDLVVLLLDALAVVVKVFLAGNVIPLELSLLKAFVGHLRQIFAARGHLGSGLRVHTKRDELEWSVVLGVCLARRRSRE